jgi:C-terminal domain 6 of the ABC-three component (ABC-3C) systems
MHPGEKLRPETLATNPKVGERFRRHRENFYKAESLRVYARDSVPPGTFERLQDDIHAGVVDVVESDHDSGLARLTSVLSLVGQLDLNRHRLISVVEIDDRKGICHQLANVDRIRWMSPNE